MSLRRRSSIFRFLKRAVFLGVGFILGVAAGTIYFYGMPKPAEAKIVTREATVWSVQRPIASGDLIAEEDLLPIQIEEEKIPLGVFHTKEEAIGKRAWVSIAPKMILHEELCYQEQVGLAENAQEISVAVIPEAILVGDYLDLRIQFPSGHDYCVLSHKKLGGLDREHGKMLLGLSEEERIRLSSAQSDADLFEGTSLYVTIYPRAVEQALTAVSYPVNGSVQKLYESVATANSFAESRNHLELALVKLKEEEKFLEARAEEAGESREGKETGGQDGTKPEKVKQPERENKKEKESTDHSAAAKMTGSKKEEGLETEQAQKEKEDF